MADTEYRFDLQRRCVHLRGGLQLPLSGFGSWSVGSREVAEHLRAGGRLIDTASYYDNEAEVGAAVRASGIPRAEIIVQTKLWPSQFADPERGIGEALRRLGLGYIDLMLLHHPGTHELRAWRAIERHIRAGDIRAGGLSNYYLRELPPLLEQAEIAPVLVQNEIHPYYQEQEVVPFIQRHALAVQAYFPLGGRGHVRRLLDDPQLRSLAAAHGVSPAQAVLRWHLQRGIMPLPGSGSPAHIAANLALWDFELSPSELQAIAALERGTKFDWY